MVATRGLSTIGRRGRAHDLWIAACALQHGLILATRERHFEQVTGLEIEDW